MAEADPDPGADAVHRLLGLPETASPAERAGAYWRLRGHIEARIASAGDAREAEARRTELRRLHAACSTLPGIDAGALSDAGPARPDTRAPRWLVAWAVVASGVALLLAVWRVAAPPPMPAETGAGTGEADARLIVSANPSSAGLTVTTGEDDRVVVTAVADGTTQFLPNGRYRAAVAHPDCPDTWRQDIELAAGEERRYAPSICRGEGAVVVRSNASGDRLQIDGVDVGSTGATAHPLRVGLHRIRVEKEGYEPWTAEVRIAPDAELTLNAELVASAGPPAAPPAPAPAPERTASAPPPPPPGGGPVAEGVGPPVSEGEKMRVRTGAGGSKSWHDAIVHDLIVRYDRNGTGSLDSAEEIQSIPCEEWRGIEQSYETGGLAVEMTHLYGFDGSEAPANTLGITNAMRGYAYDRMKACGLKARR